MSETNAPYDAGEATEPAVIVERVDVQYEFMRVRDRIINLGQIVWIDIHDNATLHIQTTVGPLLVAGNEAAAIIRWLHQHRGRFHKNGIPTG